MPERGDGFDEIVERLGLDLTFPAQVDPPQRPAAPERQHEPVQPVGDDELSDPVDEQFYRRVPSGPVRPVDRRRALAWTAVLGPAVILAVCTIFGVWLPGTALLAGGLIVVAGAVFLISQLPEHGPSRRDWPDDGAAL